MITSVHLIIVQIFHWTLPPTPHPPPPPSLCARSGTRWVWHGKLLSMCRGWKPLWTLMATQPLASLSHCKCKGLNDTCRNVIIYNEGWSSQFAHRVECSMSFSSGTWISTTWLVGLCIFCTYPETKQYTACPFATSTRLQVQCLRSYLHWMSVWKPKSVSRAAFLFTCIVVNNINIGNL